MIDLLTDEIHRLSEEVLPRAAKSGEYPVRHDHCFKRIAFDWACGAKWDTVVDQPFYKNATQRQKERALGALKQMVKFPGTAHAMNKQSLTYRTNRSCES